MNNKYNIFSGILDFYKSGNLNTVTNAVKSGLRNVPMYDSIDKYYKQKSNKPDTSNYEIAKNEALRPTQVLRSNPVHLASNYKYTPYDYTNESSSLNSQALASMNLASKQSRGNFNALMSHLNNFGINISKASASIAQNAWQAKEKERMAVRQMNNSIEQANATADNNANQAYVNAQNSANATDKQNRINALNTYANSMYSIKRNYDNLLDSKRDEMVENIATYGENAYNNNKANTNARYNYWYDDYGIQHFKKGYKPDNGYVDMEESKTAEYVFNDLYSKASSDEDKEALMKLKKQCGFALANLLWNNGFKSIPNNNQ